MSRPIKPPNEEQLVYLNSLTIDPDEGKVYNGKGIEIGFPAGGYIKIGMLKDGKWRHFKRSHLVWWESTGSWPIEKLDHEDRDKSNDRIGNLRYSSYIQNALNAEQYRGSGKMPKGVCYDPNTNATNPYKAKIVDQGKVIFLGRFKDPVEAHQVWLEADSVRREREANNQRKDWPKP